MATATITPTLTSFVYEDLVSHIQTIRPQLIAAIKYLDDQWNNEKNIKDQLKSCSLTIIDPYGTPVTQKYMDHKLVSTVLEKFKKNYVPKCFHQWIRFGRAIGNDIDPLKDTDLNLTVGQYENKYPIITYGEIDVWLGDENDVSYDNLRLKVRLNDKMETIQMQIENQTKHTPLEVKTAIVNESTTPNQNDWNEGSILKSEDTIMSKNLYQTGCIIMIKVDMEKVNHRFIHSLLYDYSLLTGWSRKFWSEYADICEHSYWIYYYLRSESWIDNKRSQGKDTKQ